MAFSQQGLSKKTLLKRKRNALSHSLSSQESPPRRRGEVTKVPKEKI